MLSFVRGVLLGGHTHMTPPRERTSLAEHAAQQIRALGAGGMRSTLLWAARRRSLRRAIVWAPPTRSLVDRFVAGESLSDALRAAGRLHGAGLRTTVDVLGEAVSDVAAADAAARSYLETIDGLADAGLDCNVSLKPSQFGVLQDAAACRARISMVASRATQLGGFVRIDMEDHQLVDPTLTMARSLHADGLRVGVVIQSYLRRSPRDVEALITEGIPIRLCKGAYREPASVAFPAKGDVDNAYVRLMERLLDVGHPVAIATHDPRILAYAESLLRSGTGPAEFQMLYGVRRDLQADLVAKRFPVRIYVPYGAEWYAYFMRRLAERPANVALVLRTLARDRESHHAAGDTAE